MTTDTTNETNSNDEENREQLTSPQPQPVDQSSPQLPSTDALPSQKGPSKQTSTRQQRPPKHKQTPPRGDPTKCVGCGLVFASRNAVFRHLKETNGVCLLENLSEQEKVEQSKEFEEHVRRTDKLQKVLILYGYLPFSVNAEKSSNADIESFLSIHNGQDAGKILMQAIQELQDDLDGINGSNDSSRATASNQTTFDRLIRSYGNISRADDCIRQDPDTATISEVMAVRLRPLRVGMDEDEWLDRVQKVLDRKYETVLQVSLERNSSETTPIRILGRLELPNANFNAETDVSQRRIEYLLPVDFLTWSIENGNATSLPSLESPCTKPAKVTSSVALDAAPPRSGKKTEGWDVPPSIAIASANSRTGWKLPHVKWKTPQRVASLLPTALTSPSTHNSPKTEMPSAAFDDTNGGGRTFCAPLIVSRGNYVLVASGATLLLYQVTSSFQQQLESLPLPARSFTPVTKLTLTVEDSSRNDRATVDSNGDSSQRQKRVGDIHQMSFHEETSILYVLTDDCCVFQVKLESPMGKSHDDAIPAEEQSSKVPASLSSTETEKASQSMAPIPPSLTICRRFQTIEFGVACMATLHNGGGEGLDVLCIGCNSGTIECWLISQLKPEMMTSLHESRRPQRKEKTVVLRWKGYVEQSVKTLSFMPKMSQKGLSSQSQVTNALTKAQDGSFPKPDELPVSDCVFMVSSQNYSGGSESNGTRGSHARVEFFDLGRIFQERIEYPRRDSISLQNFTILAVPRREISGTSPFDPGDEGPSKRSPMLNINCADAATIFSDDGSRNQHIAITLPDGTVSFFSYPQDMTPSNSAVGIVKDYHQVVLPFPAIGSGILSADEGPRGRKFLACCLRGGTCYLIPTSDDGGARPINAMPYPQDISFDLDQVFIQSFTAGNLHIGDGEKMAPVAIYASSGGMVDIYTCELAHPSSNTGDVEDSGCARGENFGARIRKDMPVFSENHKHDINHVDEAAPLPEEDIRLYMTDLKNIMKLLRTHIVAVDPNQKASVWDKQNNTKKRKQRKARRTENRRTMLTKSGQEKTTELSLSVDDESHHPPSERNPPLDSSEVSSLTAPESLNKPYQQQNYLKRKRFHNFTASVMAHQYLAYRRLDRLYHRATLELPSSNAETEKSKFAVVSMSGDLFLTGQAQRVIGVFVALANGVIDKEFVECVFDEDYPHLVPTPPAPPVGIISAEAHYMNTEGKIKSVLSPRVSNQYDSGFNRTSTLMRVKKWQEHVYNHVAKKWETDGRESTGERSNMERLWTESVLLPWAEKARIQLEDYRLWKRSQALGKGADDSTATVQSLEDANLSVVPPISTIDSSVPEAYEKVLKCLREVDVSGKWPSTTPKRQLVMVSTQDGKDGAVEQPDSLSIAHSKAKRNVAVRSSAYAFTEGEGGASGSFSVGLMPGGTNKQPKANAMFPKLVKAAFELEAKLCPHREPSSTIAINRNAQFRPHTDSGAGAGQSTSLIVGLGTYSGGELMVEGVKHDIRYKAIEFNGWKQRHWTLPFKGERYSLVWFTPKGCEGMRGIDLDLSTFEDQK